MLVGGIKISKETYALYNVSMPITKKAYDILFNGENPLSAVCELMNRDKKSEL